MTTAQEQADGLLAEHLAWLEKKHTKDQKWLKSILKEWK